MINFATYTTVISNSGFDSVYSTSDLINWINSLVVVFNTTLNANALEVKVSAFTVRAIYTFNNVTGYTGSNLFLL